MHPIRLNALRKAYPKDSCLSAISMISFVDQHLPLGTPLLITNEPFAPAIPAHIADEFNLSIDQKSGAYYYLGEKGKSKERASLVEISNLVPGHIGEVLQHSLSKIKILNFFPHRSDGWDHTYLTCNPKHVAITSVPPLIWDDGFICEIENVCGLMGGDNPAVKIYDMLESYRYVTYCYSGFNKHKTAEIFKDFKKLLGFLTAKYPVSKCYSCTEYMEACVLMDICSISFFRLSDVITIYDSKKAYGMAMDIFACSSQIKNINEMPGATMLIRFVFNIDKENLYTIDGEKINRWPDKGRIEDGLGYAINFLAKNSPQHKSSNSVGGF